MRQKITRWAWKASQARRLVVAYLQGRREAAVRIVVERRQPDHRSH